MWNLKRGRASSSQSELSFKYGEIFGIAAPRMGC